jgi:hypothetical protein
MKLRPNLFLIGAMKSGTTSLHMYLASHPQIFMSTPKEPAYFAREDVWRKGEEWYLSLFASAHDALVIGESSTSYTKAPRFAHVPERISQFNPAARLIYIMRDPVERTISQYWFAVRFYGERRDMLTAIRQDPRYTDVGNYAMQLAPYLKLFGHDNIATLTFEELATAPLQTMQKLFIWLGVESSFEPPNLHHRAGVTPDVIVVPGTPRFNNLVRWRPVQTFKKLAPPPVVELAKRLSGRWKYINRKRSQRYKVIEYLRGIQREQVCVLSEMLQRDFPEWTTLYTQAPCVTFSRGPERV